MLTLSSAFLATAILAAPVDNILEEPPCTATASLAAKAARVAIYQDLLMQIAGCINSSDDGASSECLARAWSVYATGLSEIGDVHAARLALCAQIGESPYSPAMGPSAFVQGVDHPLLPLVPGTTSIYEKVTLSGEIERIEVTVLPGTQEIAGVACTGTRVVERLGGELQEMTYDWYAQDLQGNVWYFGESSMAFEDGVPIHMDGSWRAGVAGGQPGIAMLAEPVIGKTYRKEFLLGEAEDAATVVAHGIAVSVPAGEFPSTVHVRDFSPLEPDDGEDEDKYYSHGVGLVLEVDRNTGEQLQLIEVTRG